MQNRRETIRRAAVLTALMSLVGLWLLWTGGPEAVQAQVNPNPAIVTLYPLGAVGHTVATAGDPAGMAGFGPSLVTAQMSTTGNVYLSFVNLQGQVNTFGSLGMADTRQLRVSISPMGDTCLAGPGLTGPSLICRARTGEFISFSDLSRLNDIQFDHTDPTLSTVTYTRPNWGGSISLNTGIAREVRISGGQRLALDPLTGQPWFTNPETQHIGTVEAGADGVRFTTDDIVTYYPVQPGSLAFPTSTSPRPNGILVLGNGRVLTAGTGGDTIQELDPAAKTLRSFDTSGIRPYSLALMGNRLAYTGPLTTTSTSSLAIVGPSAARVTTVNWNNVTLSFAPSTPVMATTTHQTVGLTRETITVSGMQFSVVPQRSNIFGETLPNGSVSYPISSTGEASGIGSFGDIYGGDSYDSTDYTFDPIGEEVSKFCEMTGGGIVKDEVGVSARVTVNTVKGKGQHFSFTLGPERLGLKFEFASGRFSYVICDDATKTVIIIGVGVMTYNGKLEDVAFEAEITDGGTGVGDDRVRFEVVGSKVIPSGGFGYPGGKGGSFVYHQPGDAK